MKKILLIAALAALGVVILYALNTKPKPTPAIPVLVDFMDATYEIEGEKVTLTAGSAASQPDPASATQTNTIFFGNEVRADFNADGADDIAFLLTQSRGGTGIFFYVAAALGSDNGYTGLNALLLGDRIAPQTTEFRDGTIIVNFAERAQDEPMTTPPSVGVSKYFKVQAGRLIETQP